MSKQNELAAAIVGLLEQVRTANGYATDAGLHVWRGKTYGIEPNQLPCLVLFEDEERVNRQKAGVVHTFCPYVVEASIPCDADNPNIAAQQIADDICRALFPDVLPEAVAALIADAKHFSYAGRQILPRKEGQNIVTVNVKFEAQLVFTLGR